MAIYHEQFIDSGEDSIVKLKAFLDNHCSGIFDTYAIDSESSCHLNCTKDADTPLIIGSGSSTAATIAHAKITLKNGTRKNGNSSSYPIKHVYSTSNGFMVTFADRIQDEDPIYGVYDSVFALNEDEHGLVVVTMLWTGTVSTKYVTDYAMLYNKSTAFETYGKTATKLEVDSPLSHIASKTLLIPIVFDSGDVSTKIFRMVYNEFPLYSGIFELNGKRYVTDGVFALEE